MAALENRIAPTIWLMLTTIALAGSPDVRWVVVSPLVWVITPLMVAAVPGLISIGTARAVDS
jgi:hypothetical protein